MCTVREIAKAAGVSPSTVSRVINNSPKVTEKTRQKVIQVMQQYGYVLPRQAKTINGTEENFAGLSLPSLPLGCVIANPTQSLATDHFFVDVVGGAMNYLQSIGRQLILEATNGNFSGMSSLPAMLKERSVQGLIVGGVPMTDDYIFALLNTKIPSVFIGRYLQDGKELTAVIPDNIIGGYIAGRHLLDCGYQDFFFMGGSLQVNTFRDRLEGFRRALKEQGLLLASENIIESDINQDGGYLAMKKIFEKIQKKGRTGIFASTDWMAGGVIRFLSEAGYNIPAEAGVVGYSDLELSSHFFPSITTVRINRRTLGYLAARTLVDVITGRITCPVQIYLQPSLVIRESTGCSSSIKGDIKIDKRRYKK